MGRICTAAGAGRGVASFVNEIFLLLRTGSSKDKNRVILSNEMTDIIL